MSDSDFDRVIRNVQLGAVFVVFLWAVLVEKDLSTKAIVFLLCFIYLRVDDIARERK